MWPAALCSGLVTLSCNWGELCLTLKKTKQKEDFLAR